MRVCFDLDNTIAEEKKEGQTYADILPQKGAVEALWELKKLGYEIIIHTARHMGTCNNNEAKAIAKIGKITIDWLEKYNVPYDELLFAKPNTNLFVDDKACRHEGDWKETYKNIIKYTKTNE